MKCCFGTLTVLWQSKDALSLIILLAYGLATSNSWASILWLISYLGSIRIFVARRKDFTFNVSFWPFFDLGFRIENILGLKNINMFDNSTFRPLSADIDWKITRLLLRLLLITFLHFIICKMHTAFEGPCVKNFYLDFQILQIQSCKEKLH